MNFAEEIVFDVLEKRGYVSPSLIRTANMCRWYVARKGEDLFEIEAYDSQAYANETLVEYLKSLNALPENNPFVRKPLELIAERKITCIARKYVSGEPLYTYFIRPGVLPEEEALEKIIGFEKVHKYLASNKLDNFAPLSIMFFMSKDGQAFIDGLKCGPWVTNYENLALISSYLNPELPWDQQLNFFRNSFVLKMLLDNPGLEKYEEGKGKALDTFITGIVDDRHSYKDDLSVLEKKFRPRSKGSLLRVALLSAIFILPLLAYFVRVMQSESSWMGPEYTDSRKLKELIEERDEFAFEPDEEEKIEVSHEFLQKIVGINEQMMAGNFKSALDEITELSSINLRRKEQDILNDLRTAYPERRKLDFENAVSRSRTLITESRYEEAQVILQDIIDRYERGKDTEQAFSALGKIRELEQAAKEEEEEKIAKRAAAISKDRVMVNKLDELQKNTFKIPVQELDGLNKRLDLIQIECVTKAAKYLVSCCMKMNTAEKRLYEQLLQFSDENAKKERLKLLQSSLSGLGGLDIYDINASGIEYRDPTGGGNINFSSMPVKDMYKVFKETSKVDVERAAYYLYLYCLKYDLQKEAALEFELIKNPELRADADSLRDMKQARLDLFAGK